MDAAAILTVVATVVAVHGDGLEIDKGLRDGLRRGDRGVLEYNLTVSGETRRVEVGEAEVTAASETTARLAAPGGSTTTRPGFQAVFRLPPERLLPESLALAVAESRLERGDLAGAGEQLERWLKLWQILRGDGHASAGLEAALGLLRRLAAGLLDQGRFDEAADRLAAIQQVRPGEPASLELLRWLAAGERTEMVRLEAGEFRIGAAAGQASHYNQQPAFRRRLGETWLDARPVSRQAYLLFRPDVRLPAGADSSPATGISFDQAAAYCGWRGRRLPTELEWEAAVASGGVDASEPLLEWTDSWYLPYPGNEVREEAYGERYKVLRGRGDDPRLDPRKRRFLAPEQRHSRVGFRCAGDLPRPGSPAVAG